MNQKFIRDCKFFSRDPFPKVANTNAWREGEGQAVHRELELHQSHGA